MRVAAFADWSGSRHASVELTRLHGGSISVGSLLPSMSVGLSAAAPAIGGQFEHVSVVADVRIDNLEELRKTLGVGVEADVAEVLARAYLKWGTAFPERVLGDFALVLWDGLEHRLVACRDPFGVRPLAFRRTAGTIWVASEPEQLLRTFDVRPDLDDQSVLEYLLWRHKSVDRTLFQAIRHVRGGFVLVATSSGDRTERFWVPPVEAAAGPTADRDEYFAEIRRLFSKSVERRLRSSQPVVIHVSGGLDSSSIAVAADAISRERPARTPMLIGAAAVFPGMACDESPFIDLVAESVGFAVRRWDGSHFEPSTFLRSTPADPEAGPLMTSGSDGDIALAGEVKAGVVLSGMGGDELMTFDGFIRDLIAANEWGQAFRATLLVEGMSVRSRLQRVRRVAGQFLPGSIRDHRARALAEIPGWLAPDLHSRARQLAVEDESELAFPRQVQRRTWIRLHNGNLRRAFGLMQREAHAHGFEFRFPFLDRELVTFVLGIPTSYLPEKFTHGRIHREAFRPMLPPAIVERYAKADFTPALVRRMRGSAAFVEDILGTGPWASERYVDRLAAKAFWRSLTVSRRKVRAADWWRVQAIVRLEAWLRRFSEYHAVG